MSAITMYTTSWCGYCARLKAGLARHEIGYDEIDIEQHPEAVDVVTSINGGNRTVPTLVFSDGSSATNPSVGQVAEKLAELG